MIVQSVAVDYMELADSRQRADAYREKPERLKGIRLCLQGCFKEVVTL